MDEITPYFQQTLNAAALAKWSARPNPAVGAVAVASAPQSQRNSEVPKTAGHIDAEAHSTLHSITSTGYTQPVGSAHAESVALEGLATRLNENPSLAGHAPGTLRKELYVSLTPCTFQGHTPPCVKAIIKHRVTRVHIALGDNDPRIGDARATLEQAGIQVCYDFPAAVREKLFLLNQDYYFKQRTGFPFVTVKYAMTLDGHTATHDGLSKWITGEAARQDANALRGQCDAVLVGARTLLLDNPSLQTRFAQASPVLKKLSAPVKHPRAMVWFSRDFSETEEKTLRARLNDRSTPYSYALLKRKPGNVPTSSIPHSGEAPKDTKMSKTHEAQIPIFIIQPQFRRVRALFSATQVHFHEVTPATLRDPQTFREAIKGLAQSYQLNAIFVEGGAHTASLFRWSGLAHRVIVYIAPKIMGDSGFVQEKALSPLVPVGSYLKVAPVLSVRASKEMGGAKSRQSSAKHSKESSEGPFTALAESSHQVLGDDIRIMGYRDDYDTIRSLRHEVTVPPM